MPTSTAIIMPFFEVGYITIAFQDCYCLVMSACSSRLKVKTELSLGLRCHVSLPGVTVYDGKAFKSVMTAE